MKVFFHEQCDAFGLRGAQPYSTDFIPLLQREFRYGDDIWHGVDMDAPHALPYGGVYHKSYGEVSSMGWRVHRTETGPCPIIF